MPKIFHAHVSKCGGTGLNAWLDTQVHAERARPPAFATQEMQRRSGGRVDDLDQRDPAMLALRAAVARDSIAWFDLLHGHLDLSPWLPTGSYVFTVLREPAARVVSQFRDYRRLAPHDYAAKDAAWRALHEACRMLPDFATLGATFRSNAPFRRMFEDHQCRALTQAAIPEAAFYALSPEARADAAWQFIQAGCRRAGVLEDLDALAAAVARDLGWCPPAGLERRNATDAAAPSAADLAAAEALVPADRLLHRRLVAHLRRHPHPAHTVADFERDFAAPRLAALAPMRIGAEHVFDMNMPLPGFGLHGRDSPGTRECCCWFGAEPDAALYLPVPGPGLPLAFRLFNKGWVDPGLSSALRVTVDDVPVAWQAERRPEVSEAIRFRATTRRPWVKIGLHCDAAMTDAEAGRPGDDRRRKVFNLWRYSYALA
jgi:hypothetical protein